MKTITLIFISFILFLTINAQNNLIRNPSIAVHFFFDDFQTASDLRNQGLANVLRDKQWSKIDRLKPGIALSYIQGLSNHIDFAVTGSGSFVDYPIPETGTSGNDNFLLEVAATANLKLLSDKYIVNPFLTIGAGVSQYKGYYGAFIPIGVGLQFNILNNAFVVINSQYRAKATENVNYHLYHSFGIGGTIFEKKVEELKPLPVPLLIDTVKDRDNDGVIDSLDKCPDVAGITSMQGCPDKDGDGITDAADKCPDVAGLARYNGCPIPDTDGDGVNDELDKCPAVAGFARYQGCPVPDTDKDGVNDEEDKCPQEAGLASNFGCPEIAKATIEKINIAAQHIFFATGSAKLLPKSYKSLNELVKILNDNPAYKLEINGHTDNTGKAEKNQILSENRAKSVAEYLKTKGIMDNTKLITIGFGQNKPIADNKKSVGRAKNRRVEISVKNY